MNTKLLAFHNDPAIKEKYITRVRQHRIADQLVKGLGWNPESGKGCAIGCTLETYNHSRYPIELGLPEWLARLEDAIFEGLPVVEAQAWPEAFLEAIHPGADLEPVRHQLAIRRIDRLIALQQSNLGKHAGIDPVIHQTIAALTQVRRCHEAEIGGNVCDAQSAAWSAARSAAESAESAAWSAARSAAESAESAAWSAAESAESAAWSAARSAESAESAARSAESAESAAGAVAWSAARSAAQSAWSAAWKQETTDLLELLREAA